MQSILVLLLCVVGVAVGVRDVEWESFKSSYGRQYENPTEEALRKKIFHDNKVLIDQQNQLYAQGKSTFTMGVNQFADMTIEEFTEKKDEGFGTSFSHQPVNSVESTPREVPTADITIDWRNSGCVPPVPNSELCSMSTVFLTETVEFCQCKKYAIKINLSDQCLTDCCQNYGVPSVNYYKCLVAQGGVSTEAKYPTTTCTPSMCKYTAADSGARVGSWVDIITGWESNLQRGLNSSVVHTAVDTTHSSFQLYSGGVYNEPLCSNHTNHNVLVVGYGTDVSSGADYWLVQNSWGTSWGEAGYIRMSRNKDNQCGIATYAGYPIC